MSKHLRLNPWLIIIGIAAILVFASLAGLNSFISTKAKPVPNKLQPGDNYPVNYTTSKSVPSVRIDLCSDSTNTPCVPMVASATGTQTTIVIPGTFATGQAHINVLERNSAQQLTGVIQRTTFVTIVAPGSNAIANNTGTTSTSSSSGSSGLAAFFGSSGSSDSSSTTSSTTTSSTSSSSSNNSNSFLNSLGIGSTTTTTFTPFPTPSPTPRICKPTDCPATTPIYRYCTDGKTTTSVPMECIGTSSTTCGWSLPYCGSGTWETTKPTPTPTPVPIVFNSITIHYQTYGGDINNPYMWAEVYWSGPADAHISFSKDNGHWADSSQSYDSAGGPGVFRFFSNILGSNSTTSESASQTVYSRIELTQAQIGYNQMFYIAVRSQSNQEFLTPSYRYFSGYPNPGEQTRYIVGQNGEPNY